MKNVLSQLLATGCCALILIDCGGSGQVTGGATGQVACAGSSCNITSTPNGSNVTGGASPGATSTPPGGSSSPSAPSASPTPPSSWSCSVDIVQAGQTVVDPTGAGVPGTCGTGVAPSSANVCNVTPPGQSSTLGWCQANPGASPSPGTSSMPSSAPQTGSSPSSGMICPATIQQGANTTKITSCGVGTGPAGSISPCFITTTAGQLVSGWCLP